MHNYSPSLPLDCLLRPACAKDRWAIQWAVHRLVFESTNLVIPSLSQILLGISLALFILIESGVLFQKLVLPLICLSVIIIYFIQALKEWPHFWVIECNKQVVACLALHHYGTYSALYSLFVEPGWRNQGLGSYLVKHLAQKATKPLYLACQPQLSEFYTRLGFAVIPLQEIPPSLQYELLGISKHGKMALRLTE